MCRDARDQVFIVLAQVGRADALVTGDQDILAMRAMLSGLLTAHIMTPDALAKQLDLD